MSTADTKTSLVSRYLPGIAALGTYRRDWLTADALAGLMAVFLSLLDAALKPFWPHSAVLARVPCTARHRDVDHVEGAAPPSTPS